MDTVASVGAMEEAGADVLGEITAIAARPDGDFVVLDPQAKKLLWFARDGKLLASGGRDGSGPGEFKAPRAVIVRGDTATVLDAGNNRLVHFLLRPTTLAYSSSTPLPMRDRSFCSLGARTFINVARDGNLVHEVDGGGARLHSFAEVPVIAGLESLGFFKSMAEQQLTSGVIACLGNLGLIVIAPTARPYMSAYRADGTHVWTTTLTDYKQFEYELVPPATLRQKVANGEAAHIAQQVVPWYAVTTTPFPQISITTRSPSR